MTNKIIAAMDCDEISYMVAAACETRTIKVTNTTNGECGNFKHRTELKKFLSGLDVPEGFFTIEDVQTTDELPNALHSVKMVISSYEGACRSDITELYISGKGNFRDALPLPTKYKSARADNLKPLLLDEIRKYLIEKRGAVVVNGMETDDKICERMWEGYKSGQKIIGCTRDKDACSNMGWLYNRDKMTEPEFIDGLGNLYIDGKNKVRGQGRKFGYLQWIIGDPTDSYNPSEVAKVKYGEKSGYKLLEPLQTDKECIQAIYDLYKTWYPAEVKYTDWQGNEVVTDAIGMMQMYMDCYRMRRSKDDLVKVTDILTKLEIKID